MRPAGHQQRLQAQAVWLLLLTLFCTGHLCAARLLKHVVVQPRRGSATTQQPWQAIADQGTKPHITSLSGGPRPERHDGQAGRELLQAVTNNQSKQQQPGNATVNNGAQPSWSANSLPLGWCNGGPGGGAFPLHASKSSVDCDQWLPESVKPTVEGRFTVAEGNTPQAGPPPAATNKPVPETSLGLTPDDYGLGGPTFPSSRGARGVVTRLSMQTAASKPDLGGGHTIAPINSSARRRLSGMISFEDLQDWMPNGAATAVAAATATAVSDSGQALAVNMATAKGNSTAISTSNATSTGNGTAVAIGTANATDGKVFVAHADAESTNGKLAVSIVYAAPANGSVLCVLAGFAFNNKTFLACGNVTDLAASNTSANSTSPSLDALSLLDAAWLSAPVCRSAPSANNSVVDTLGRLWGLEDESVVCAFRDATGASLTYPELVLLDFATAPACEGVPKVENSIPDRQHRLWGYLGTGDNCAFKDVLGQPVFYPGYVKDPAGASSAANKPDRSSTAGGSAVGTAPDPPRSLMEAPANSSTPAAPSPAVASSPASAGAKHNTTGAPATTNAAAPDAAKSPAEPAILLDTATPAGNATGSDPAAQAKRASSPALADVQPPTVLKSLPMRLLTKALLAKTHQHQQQQPNV